METQSDQIEAQQERSKLLTTRFYEVLEGLGVNTADISREQIMKIHCIFDDWKKSLKESCRIEVCFDLYTRSYDVVVIAEN
ncbi:hypothetical protein [Wolinella succinogenes]|uniref:hypothetical protein n=1 Tax=Wolinella succinogenes TaxID=844 RepID=UPI002409A325|nr:hypothetical protein [Wolinella succinogenes]